MEGSPKFAESQTLPDVDYAAFARSLGLNGAQHRRPPTTSGPAWDQALAADRPERARRALRPRRAADPAAGDVRAGEVHGQVDPARRRGQPRVRQARARSRRRSSTCPAARTTNDRDRAARTRVALATSAPLCDVVALERALAERVDGEVRFDAGHPGRVLHRRVQLPAGTDRRRRAAQRSRPPSRPSRSAGSTRAPVVSRGGGTSLAGQCTNTAVMIDWAKYCNRLLSVDARGAHLRRRAGHRPRRAQRAARPARPVLRARAGHPPELHARRDDRQQLLRRDRAAHRQGRRQHRPARGAALRRHPVLVRRDQRRGVRTDRTAR